MNQTRSRLRFLLLLLLPALLALPRPPAVRAQEVPDEPAISYDEAREAWLRDRLRSLTRRLVLQEELLTDRLTGIREEGERSGSLDVAELEALLSDDAPHVLSATQPPDTSAALAGRLDYWMLRQQEILGRKLDLSGELRRRQARSLAPAALEEMFRRDLGRAIAAYEQGRFGLAGLLFQDLLELYPYQNLDDIRFYRAEAALADGAWDTAVENYLQLLRTQPDSEVRAPAFRHLIYLRSVFGQHATAVAECDEFKEDLAAADGEVAYLCGREFFITQRYPEARHLLERVGQDEASLLRARHLVGLCLILENKYDEAIAAFEDLLKHNARLGLEAANDEALREDARLKLGYLYFETGKFQQASQMFESVAQGERRPEALLGEAWSGLSLADHERALSLSRQLVEHFPASPFRYEAMTLAGFASEQAGQKAEARQWYDQVLDEAQRSQEMRELSLERQQVLQLLRRLVEMEPAVFRGGKSEHFDEYMRLRGESRVLMNRVKYTELQTANESLREYIAERQQIVQLSRGLKKVLRRGLDEAKPEQRQELAALNREVQRLLQRIRLAGLVEIQRQPLMIHERTLSSVNAMLDSLALSSHVELGRLEKRSGELEESRDFPRSLYRQRFERLEQDLERLRSHATAIRHRPVTSNLPRWSELAFSRLAIGDIEFDELKRIEERLDELDGYLGRISGLLEGGQSPAEGARP